MIERFIDMFETLERNLSCAIANDDEERYYEVCEQIDALDAQFDKIYPHTTASTLH